MKSVVIMALLLMAFITSSYAVPSGVWNFNGDLNSANGAAALTIGGGAAGAAKTSFITTDTLAGGTKKVMKFGPFDGSLSEGLLVNANLKANGGGTKVNQYTIVMDYKAGTDDQGYYAIYNSDPDIANDPGYAEFFVCTDNTMGIGDYVTSNYTPGDWVRLAITVDVNAGILRAYTNGVLRGIVWIDAGKDGQFALSAGLANMIMFCDNEGGTSYTGDGYISSLAIYNEVLPAPYIAALGGPSAAGISATNPTFAWSGTANEKNFNAAADGDIWTEFEQMFVINGDTLAYNGTGQAVYTRTKDAGYWPNAGWSLQTNPTESMELVLDLKPGFTADGLGQNLNVKVDAPEIGFYINNDSGSGGGWSLMFGAADIFNPLPINVVSPSIAAKDVTDLRLVFKYDAVSGVYRAFYGINGGALVEHTASPVTKTRTSAWMEFQFFVGNAANPSPYTIGFDNFVEKYQNIIVPVELSSFSAE